VARSAEDISDELFARTVGGYAPPGSPSARPDLADLAVPPGAPGADESTWGARTDGSPKGRGWLGLLRRPDGKVSSELSVGVQLDGKETEIPLLVPTLTRAEVDAVLSSDKVPPAALHKAVAFARERVAAGKDPFASADESPRNASQDISDDAFYEAIGPSLPPKKPPALPAPKAQGVGLGDYASSVMLGGANLAQGFGWLADQVGAHNIGKAIEDLGSNAVDYWTEKLSPAAKDALAREFVHRDPVTGDLHWGNPTLSTVGLLGAQSLLGTAAGMGTGGLITKGLMAGLDEVLNLFGNPMGREALLAAAKAGSTAAAKKLNIINEVLGAVGGGLGEGVTSAVTDAQSVDQAVRALPMEKLQKSERFQQIYNSTDEAMPPEQRLAYARETLAKEASTKAGWQSGLVVSLLGAPMGAFFGRFLGGSAELAKTTLGSLGKAALGEAAQEAAQSAVEQETIDRQLVAAGQTDLDTFQDALNNAVGGAAAGGLMGGAVGLVHGPHAPVPRGTRPQPTGPQAAIANAAMRAARAGANQQQLIATVQGEGAPLDKIKTIRGLESEALDSGAPQPPEPPPGGSASQAAPSPLDISNDIDQLAHNAATSALNTSPTPTPEQIEAENYEAGRIPGEKVGMRSLDFAVEYPRGTERHGVEMTSHYGRIPGAVGGDGMALDFFMGQNPEAPNVYLYHRLDAEGRFHQHKPMIGFDSEDAARAELAHFYRGAENVRGPITTLTKPQFENWVASGKTAQPHPDSGLPIGQAYEGEPTRVVTPGGESVNARYRLMELADLTSSHALTGKPNGRYPQELQPRDRSRAGLRQWIVETAARFEPALAVEGAGAESGAPIVGPDGVVESGNGRVAVLTKLYNDKSTRNPNDVSQRYRQYLAEHAQRFGFTPEQVNSLSRPVLVRMRTDAMDLGQRARFAREANRPALSVMSATEQARADAAAIGPQDLQNFSPDESGNVLAPSNSHFVNAFLQKMPASERAGLLTSDGAPTKQLAQRIQAAVFSSAYQDDRALSLMAEDANPDVRNVVAALTRAAPTFARARAAGGLSQADVVTPLMQALDILRTTRASGQSVDEYLGQGALFGSTPPEVAKMARFLDRNIRSPKRMGDALTHLAAHLETSAISQRSGSLIPEAPATVDTALEAANQRMEAEHGPSGQGGLFQEPSEPYAARQPGEDDKAYLKRAIDTRAAPGSIPYAPERYFTHAETMLPVDQLVSTKTEAENAQGGANAPKRLMAAYHGAVSKRAPITVRRRADGRYDVVDGNGTVTALRAAGWPAVPVQDAGQSFPLREGGATYQQEEPRRGPLPARPASQLDLFLTPVLQDRDKVQRFASARGIQTGTFRSALQKVSTPEDAAHVLAPLRRGAQEHMAALVTDRDGRPLAVIRHQIGDIASTGFNSAHLLGQAANIPGATNLWLSHNHPGGNPRQSDADHSSTKKLAMLARDTGLTVHGMVTFGGRSNEATFYAPHAGEGRFNIPPGPRAATSAAAAAVPYYGERRLFKSEYSGHALTGAGSARDFLGAYNPDSKPGLLLMNFQGEPAAWVPMTQSEMDSLRTLRLSTGAGRLVREIEATNASRAVIVAESRGANVGNLALFLRQHGIDVNDVLAKGPSGALISSGAPTVMPGDRSSFYSRSGPAGPRGPAHWGTDAVYSHAIKNQAHLADIGRRISDRLGIEFKNPGIKGRADAETKVSQRKGGKPISYLTDIVRGGFTTDSMAEADQVVQALRDEGLEVHDEGLVVTSSGFTNRVALVTFQDGQVGEVQMWPRSLYDVKYGEGDALYREQRKLLVNGRVPEHLQEQWDDYDRRSRELYAEALGSAPLWAEAVGRVDPEFGSLINERQSASGSTAPALRASPTSTSVQEPSLQANAASSREGVSPVTTGSPSHLRNAPRSPGLGVTGKSTPESLSRSLQNEIAAVRSVVPVEVVQSVQDLPDPHAPPDVEGAYFQDGSVWLVADNIRDPIHGREVLRHEIGHAAMERHRQLAKRLEQVKRAIRAGQFKDLLDEVRSRQGLLDETTEAKEVMALAAERGKRGPLMSSLRGAVQDFGRSLGFDMGTLSEDDLNRIVVMMGRDLARDARIMRDFRAAQHLPEVRALEKAEPTNEEIVAAINAIYEGRGDSIDTPPAAEPARRSADIQDFGDLQLVDRVQVEGEEGTTEVRQSAQRVFEDARDRVKLLERLRTCLAQ
jgi:hypothetical protein